MDGAALLQAATLSVVAAQCCLAAALLAADARIRARRAYGLSLFFALCGCLAALELVVRTQLVQGSPDLKALSWLMVFLLTPSLHAAVRGFSLGERPRSSTALAAHALPAVAAALSVPIVVSAHGGAASAAPTLAKLSPALWFLFAGQSALYLALSLRLLRQDARRIRDYFSFEGSPDQRRLHLLLVLVLLPWTALVLELVVGRFVSLGSDLRWAAGLFRAACLYAAATIALEFRAVLTAASGIALQSGRDGAEASAEIDRAEAPAASYDETGPRYARSPLADEAAERIARRLTDAMRKEHFYRDPFLTLRQLSDHVGVPQHKISQVLNQYHGHSFFDFVNEARVREAHRRLVAEPATPVTQIAAEVGFNSKSTFNAAFKRWIGTTPTTARQSEAGVAAEEKRNPQPLV